MTVFRAIGPSGSESRAFPIRGSHFNRRLRALTAAGAGEIIPASFRRGGATSAVSCGVPGEIVKAMGDWRSTAYSCYVKQNAARRLLTITETSLPGNSLIQCVHESIVVLTPFVNWVKQRIRRGTFFLLVWERLQTILVVCIRMAT